MASPGHDALALQADECPHVDTPLADWLAWLEARRGEHIDLGLERCREVADRLALGRPAPTVVTVAGTNGKGSSVALLETIWRAAGYRTGTYTSPHLLRYNERMRIDGQPIPDRDICAAFARVEAHRGDVPLTYFEFATLAALLIFAASDLEIVILEVGLGGRLDAVNIIDADVALIAAIGLDHEDWLGETREQIAVEKAGIMRAGRPVVCSDHAAPESISSSATQIGAELTVLGVGFAYEPAEGSWTWWSGDHTMARLPWPALDGAHQLRNAAGVLKVIDLLAGRHPVAETCIRAGLEQVQLGGRFHRLSGRFEYVLDVAHNPQAAEIFAATLRSTVPAGRSHALIGMLKTKNHLEFLRPLIGLVDSWHFADLPGLNGARASDLAACLRQLDRAATPHCHASVERAHLALEEHAQAGERILVIGSCLTVGAMMRVLDTRPEGRS